MPLRHAVLVLLAAVAVPAQVSAPALNGPVFHADVDDSERPYALYLPKAYDAAKKYPLVISLHGEASNHRLDMLRLFGRAAAAMDPRVQVRLHLPDPRGVDFIVACPLARGDLNYPGIPERDLDDLLAELKRRYSIDEERIYLTGISQGGAGALWLALSRPDLWAAVAAVCPSPAPGLDDLAGNALNLPVHLFHGDEDVAVPVSASRRLHKRLLEAGVRAGYTEYPGVRHNAWDYAYRAGAIFEWFAQFRRERYPERVRFRSTSYRYAAAYWVRLDLLTPGTPAAIDVRFAAPNRIEIATTDLDAFTVTLAGHPRFAPSSAVAVSIDGQALRVKPAAALSFHRDGARWQPGLRGPAPAGKRFGAEGPAPAALHARHIYVYGTAGAPEDEELQRRHALAAQAAAWSTPRARLRISFAVKADRDVTDADIATSNLVLFGTRETNTLLARFADRLPLSLNPGAADYGLVFVAPLEGGRYALVNSGLPWWTGAGRAGRAGAAGAAQPYRVAETFPDFLLFKGSLANVVAEGLFDRDWKLPPAAAAKMKATGTLR